MGLRIEATILGELVRRGFRVLKPFGENHRYDLVIDLDGRFVRVQCKSGRLRRGVVNFSTASVRSNTDGRSTRGYAGEADLFVVYCPDNHGIYAVPVDEAPAGYMNLRVAPPLNKQARGVRWAADYALPE